MEEKCPYAKNKNNESDVIRLVLTRFLKIKNKIIHIDMAIPTKRSKGKTISVGNNKWRFSERIVSVGKIAKRNGCDENNNCLFSCFIIC